jgi:retron-type reverse transcriptase
MHRNSTNVSTKQERIAALAKQSPEMAFTSLAYLMDIDWLKEAYRLTRKDGAVGVDGVTAEQYEQNLEGNLQSLLDRAKSGTYKAPPVRRVHIPKGGSSTETRPLGIPTLAAYCTSFNEHSDSGDKITTVIRFAWTLLPTFRAVFASNR